VSAGELTPEMVTRCRQLCQYIRNTGHSPLAVHDFDDDWTPAGDAYRSWLKQGGYIEEREADPAAGEVGGIYLTAAGEALI
jgi:hypothetical protein